MIDSQAALIYRFILLCRFSAVSTIVEGKCVVEIYSNHVRGADPLLEMPLYEINCES